MIPRECKIVIATNALGMGVNLKKIRTVIHYGPPRHIDDFIQEIGRAGRDNLPAMSILMSNGKLLRKCDSNIKLFASNSEQCFREILLAQFATSFMPHDTLHNCCTVCHKKTFLYWAWLVRCKCSSRNRFTHSTFVLKLTQEEIQSGY